MEKRERERDVGWGGDLDGIKERRVGVTAGARQASNYLPSGDLTP